MGTFSVSLPDGTVIPDVPNGTSRQELFSRLQQSRPDVFKRNLAIEPSLQNYVPTAALEKAAAGNVPSLADEAATVSREAVQGVGSMLKGLVTSPLQALRQASPTGLSGTETMENLATPSDMTRQVASSPSEAAVAAIPGAETATSLADLAARAAGHAPLRNETIDQAQSKVAQGAGQAAAMAAAPSVAEGAQSIARAAAVPIAEEALGVGSKGRAFGKTPGEAVLNETSGLRPQAVLQSAREAMGKLGGQLQEAYGNAGEVSIQPAIDVLEKYKQQALASRRPDLATNIQENIDRLSTDLMTGQPKINMPASELWAVKRGQGDITAWNPNVDPRLATRMNREVYRAIDNELDRAAPETEDLNQRYSSLREVARRADIESRNSGILQSAMGRIARHTGGSAAGAYELLRGNIPGAVAAILGPEILSSPTVQMGAARGLWKLGGGGLDVPPVAASAIPSGEPNANISSSPNPATEAAASAEAPGAGKVGPNAGGTSAAPNQSAEPAAPAPAQPVWDNTEHEDRLLSINSAKAKGWAGNASDETKAHVIDTIQQAASQGASMADIFSQLGPGIMRAVGKDAGISDAELNGMIKGNTLTHQGQVHLGQILRSWLENGGNKQ